MVDKKKDAPAVAEEETLAPAAEEAPKQRELKCVFVADGVYKHVDVLTGEEL